jgi:hypothetical protein
MDESRVFVALMGPSETNCLGPKETLYGTVDSCLFARRTADDRRIFAEALKFAR